METADLSDTWSNLTRRVSKYEKRRIKKGAWKKLYHRHGSFNFFLQIDNLSVSTPSYYDCVVLVSSEGVYVTNWNSIFTGTWHFRSDSNFEQRQFGLSSCIQLPTSLRFPSTIIFKTTRCLWMCPERMHWIDFLLFFLFVFFLHFLNVPSFYIYIYGQNALRNNFGFFYAKAELN